MIGENIKKYRELAGLSQNELADRLGYSKPLIAHWEKGIRTVSALNLKEVANVLNVDIAKFYE